MNKFFATLVLAGTSYLGAPWWRAALGPATIAADYQSLVASERAFSDFTGKHGIRAGFTRFLADEALVVAQGRFRLGKPVYEQVPEQPTVLSWQPVYADIAASGDFGYTTGPFEVRPRATAAPAGFGQYTSIWRKTSTGEWKVVADVGISYPAPNVPPQTAALLPFEALPARTAIAADTAARRRELLNAEQALDKIAATQSQQAAYKSVLSTTRAVRLYRAGSLPYVGPAATAFAATQTQPATYTPLRAVVATSGDLGFTYGYSEIERKKGPFLRIWKRGAKHSWELVHEVLDVQ
ncbi:DUF4440 domain-containing protein [Hymenobacter cavernae]|uniref:DUF4440 domain-containing protein n=1 Tax=Hymenobacter cavernae TaxID=2044852 RepID=A0ABQ1UBX6_9BACT|nr:DUF4440 domain-containing protein [Hymenobacter cavernae]GGF15396.1 hypothetical protein GCM10011383_28350 [Hymenobacter cavernae]